MIRSLFFRHFRVVKSNQMKLLLGTRKGLVIYENSGDQWKPSSVHFLGIPVSLTFVDPITGDWWAALDHGHWGQKLQRSSDRGETWTEITAPKYPEGEEVKEGVPAATQYLWAFNSLKDSEGHQLLIGTEPGGLFESRDNGASFELNRGLWDHESRKEQWFGGGRDNPGIHSIVIDPRNSDHRYIGISVAGVFETADAGKTWKPQNKGLRADFLPDPEVPVGHDPHLLVACPSAPDVMWQQNHCGIFKSENGARDWKMVSQNGGPAHFGFAVAVDENDPDKAWVAPGISDEVRVAVDQSLCICRTTDGGKTWTDQRNGLPQDSVFDIVYRHALSKHRDWLVFGTTTGNVYTSNDGGESWTTLSNNLPMVYSTEIVD
jgi:hypothetical protein